MGTTRTNGEERQQRGPASSDEGMRPQTLGRQIICLLGADGAAYILIVKLDINLKKLSKIEASKSDR